MAIAWIYREDYERAGYRVLPRGPARVRWVVLQTVLPLLALVVLTLTAVRPMQFRLVYATGTLLLGLGFLYYGAAFALRTANADARKLLFASIVYLPLLFALMTTFRA